MKISLGPHTALCPAPVWIIGSYDGEGNPDMMTASWAGICSSSPACVNVSIRKERHSYANIAKKKVFSVNIPSENMLREADYFGIVSGSDPRKMARARVSVIRSALIDAPLIEHCPLTAECAVLHTLDVGSHTVIVGKILDVKADAETLDGDKKPDMLRVKPFVYSPSQSAYYRVGEFLADAFSAGRELTKRE